MNTITFTCKIGKFKSGFGYFQGMFSAEPDVKEVLSEFEHLPRFDDGRIDFSTSNKAPILICFVKCEGKILLLKRSDKVRIYKSKWATIAGYIDEEKSLAQMIKQELVEEIGVTQDQIESIQYDHHFTDYDKKNDKEWVIYPVLVYLKSMPQITLDWEHTEHKWITLEEFDDYDVVDNLKLAKTKVRL